MIFFFFLIRENPFKDLSDHLDRKKVTFAFSMKLELFNSSGKVLVIQERAKRTLVVTSHSNYPKVGSSGGLYTWVLQGCLIRPLLVLLHQRIPVYHYHHLQYMVQWIDCSTRNFRVLGFDMVGHLLHQKSKYSSLRFLFYSQILLRSTLVAENFTSELSKPDKTRFFGEDFTSFYTVKNLTFLMRKK